MAKVGNNNHPDIPARAARTGAYFNPNVHPVIFESVFGGPKYPRNKPCPCQSGKKFKVCHGQNVITPKD